jgi:hypothetical protein
MDIGNPTFRAPFAARQVHTEDLIPDNTYIQVGVLK